MLLAQEAAKLSECLAREKRLHELETCVGRSARRRRRQQDGGAHGDHASHLVVEALDQIRAGRALLAGSECIANRAEQFGAKRREQSIVFCDAYSRPCVAAAEGSDSSW